jgi:uncharacterized RDD family membrane protein YckC
MGFIAFFNNQQRLGDIVAKTVVIEAPKKAGKDI